MSHKFRFKIINETRNCFVEEIEQHELINKKDKKVCTTVNYIERFLFLASANTRCILLPAFASLFDIPIGINSSSKLLKMYAMAGGIKKYKSIITKKKKKLDNIAMLAKIEQKLNSIEVLISQALIHSNISPDESFLMINALKEYDKEKEEIKNLKDLIALRTQQFIEDFSLFIKKSI